MCAKAKVLFDNNWYLTRVCRKTVIKHYRDLVVSCNARSEHFRLVCQSFDRQKSQYCAHIQYTCMTSNNAS